MASPRGPGRRQARGHTCLSMNRWKPALLPASWALLAGNMGHCRSHWTGPVGWERGAFVLQGSRPTSPQEHSPTSSPSPPNPDLGRQPAPASADFPAPPSRRLVWRSPRSPPSAEGGSKPAPPHRPDASPVLPADPPARPLGSAPGPLPRAPCPEMDQQRVQNFLMARWAGN